MENNYKHLSIRPTFVEINLKNAQHNFNEVKKVLDNQKILCIVKGNAYGHGLTKMAHFFEKIGADYLGVAIPEEGITLRNSGIKIPILVLSSITDEQISMCIDNNLTMTVPSDKKLMKVDNEAKKLNKIANIHLKIDTGMGRIGVHYSRVNKFLPIINKCKNCNIEGIYSHLAKSDEAGENTDTQIKRFQSAISEFKNMCVEFPIKHIANSGGILFYPNSHFNMVRAGIILYGLFDGIPLPKNIDIKPVMSWKTKVVYFKYVEKDTGIGYGHSYVTKKDTRIVTLPIGYADGYQRNITSKGKVIINNNKYPIVGRICMDQMMVNIGIDGEAYCGDEVILVGSSKNDKIDFYDLASWSNTSIYELISQISCRVPRVYVEI